MNSILPPPGSADPPEDSHGLSGHVVPRRDFLRSLAASLTSAIPLISLLEACQQADMGVNPSALTGQKVTLVLASQPSLQAVGGFIRQTFDSNNGGRDAIVIRLASTGSDAFKTMSVVCTHQGCNLNSPSQGEVLCPCHGSVFSAQSSNFGKNLSGPAPNPLQTFDTTFDGTTITINF